MNSWRGNVRSTTDTPINTATKLKRIAWLSAIDPQMQFGQLMHLFNKDSLANCFHELSGNKAVGIDGIAKKEYGENLGENLESLLQRMRSMTYKPSAVRQVLIPKDGTTGATRPLGISNFEDKLVQKMMQKVLEEIHEPLFLDCSYGFRPGLGCHDAIRSLHQYLFKNQVRTVIDVDLENFFGTIDHQKLMVMLKDKISDKRLLRYISRMFKAGVLANGELQISDEGVPQGSICSPVLANIFAHWVIDDWFQQTVKSHCRGKVEMFRYCDDVVICCQFNEDATRVLKALNSRLSKFSLRLNEAKTTLVDFTRPSKPSLQPNTFNFLGFTFYWAYSKKKLVIPKLKTEGKRLREKLKKINQWARLMKSKYPLPVIWQSFCRKMRGHINYYGVSHNAQAVQLFLHLGTRTLFKQLNRRSQKRSFTWEKFDLFRKANPPPKVKVYHSLF